MSAFAVTETEGIEVVPYETKVDYVNEVAEVSQYKTYVSKSFISKSGVISALCTGGSTSPGYSKTMSLEVRNSNGSWSTVKSNTSSTTSSISAKYVVTPGEIYRIKVTTNSLKQFNAIVEAWGWIYD